MSQKHTANSMGRMLGFNGFASSRLRIGASGRGCAASLCMSALLLALPAASAHSAGLGKLAVLSMLGQPFHAEIDVVARSQNELNTLAARLASADAYRQAGLQYATALDGLKFTLAKRPDGAPFIKVTSNRPVTEPMMDLLVELAWSSGRISHAYTALLDPPKYDVARSAPEPVAVAEVSPVSVTEAEVPVAVAEVSPVSVAESEVPVALPPNIAQSTDATGPSSDQYGPIKRGETLIEIAKGVQPEGLTLEQVLVALYRTNPDAFVGNVNRMKTGPVLNIPSQVQMEAIPSAEARKELQVQAADWKNYQRRLADAAATVPEERGPSTGRITARVEDASAPENAHDVVRLSTGEPPASVGAPGARSSVAERVRMLEEEAIAGKKRLTEANERIAELEATIKQQQQLLTLKSESLAAKQLPANENKAAAQAAALPQQGAAPAQIIRASHETDAPQLVTNSAKSQSRQLPRPKAARVPPAPAPDLLETILGEPLYLAGSGSIVLLGALLFMRLRRRAS
jgi:pilus assembly protein FimV